MKRQLPEAGEIFLDHVAHFVRGMAEGAAALERAGFRLTPLAVQTNLAPDGTIVPAGTANRCAMLRNGYVELLAKVSDTPIARQLDTQVARHVGLHLIAFANADPEAEHARLARDGFAPLPVVRLRRPASGGGEARFTVVRVAPETMPEGRMQMVTHHTEETVWRAADMAHPNGAVALEEVTVVVEEPAAVVRRYARFLGRTETSPASPQAGEGETLHLDRGALRFLAPATFTREMPFVAIPSLPFIAATRIGVADLDATRRFIASRGLAGYEVRGGMAVPLPAEAGGTIIFRTTMGGSP